MAIRFHHASDASAGIPGVVGAISDALRANKKVLWLIAGGSNIPIAVQIMQELRDSVPIDLLSLLSVAETDERYGPVGHADSNWKQMMDAGFDWNGAHEIHALRDLPLEETSASYGADIEKAFDDADYAVAQFGIGADGHIAGVLPHSAGVYAESAVVGYEAKPFTRITLTLGMISRINAAYVFAFGDSKREAMQNLKNSDISIDIQPAQIVKKLGEVDVYSDVV